MASSPRPNNNPSYTPATAGGTGKNIFDVSANAGQRGINALSGVASGQPNRFQNEAAGLYRNVTGPGAVQYSINQYMNPYQGQVIDDLTRRMRERRSGDLNSIRQQAAQSSAFGGARQGLVEAEVMDRYAQAENEAISSALQNGFNSAANLGQGYMQAYLSSAGGLANLGQNQANQQIAAGNSLVNAAPTLFNMGQETLNMQQRAGESQRLMGQNILNQAGQQYDTYSNYPQQTLSTVLAALSGNPLQNAGTQTSSYKPGMFDYLRLAGSTYAAGK